jgi:hypothetical protein
MKDFDITWGKPSKAQEAALGLAMTGSPQEGVRLSARGGFNSRRRSPRTRCGAERMDEYMHSCSHKREQHAEYCHFCDFCPSCCVCQFWLSGDFDEQADDRARLAATVEAHAEAGLSEDEILF